MNFAKIFNLSPGVIMEYQQNRYPCFFVDVITEINPGKNAKGYKFFSKNEWYYLNSTEQDIEVPKVIQCEALEQVFLMTFLVLPEYKNKRLCHNKWLILTRNSV